MDGSRLQNYSIVFCIGLNKKLLQVRVHGSHISMEISPYRIIVGAKLGRLLEIVSSVDVRLDNGKKHPKFWKVISRKTTMTPKISIKFFDHFWTKNKTRQKIVQLSAPR